MGFELYKVFLNEKRVEMSVWFFFFARMMDP
jgi:hypothetical protein